MQNIKANQLQKAIVLSKDEFVEILRDLFGEATNCSIDYDSIYIYIGEITDGWDDDGHEDLAVEEVCEALSKFFDVEVTSYHADSAEYTEIWIAYK